MASVERRRVTRLRDGEFATGPDQLAIEEPLEIEVDGTVVSTTMRTPGQDIELALGWLVSEGALTSLADVAEAKECFEHVEGADEDQVRRIVQVRTRSGVPVEPRLHSTSSACGVCGADLIALTERTRRWSLADDGTAFDIDRVLDQPRLLRESQRGFDASGGLHAAALFGADGDLLCLREDVGRHNAVDKVVGWALADGRLPLSGLALQVSGRASAELVHKAVMAGVPILAAVSAPSTLAVDLARASGLTLVGFVRDGSLNIYAGGERLGLAQQD
ncbi:MAG: formate dehydrogenase accessory sulfurtransferase FdhD [Candidatus Nanopelagicales bacterium]